MVKANKHEHNLTQLSRQTLFKESSGGGALRQRGQVETMTSETRRIRLSPSPHPADVSTSQDAGEVDEKAGTA